MWVVAVAALSFGANAAGERTSDNLTLPGTGSTNAQDLLQDKLPQQAYGTNPIVLESSKAGSTRATTPRPSRTRLPR